LPGIDTTVSEASKTVTNPYYNLFVNNCTQVSWTALLKGELNDGTNIDNYLASFNSPIINTPQFNMASIYPNVNADSIGAFFGSNTFTYEEANKAFAELGLVVYLNHGTPKLVPAPKPPGR